MDAWWQCEVPYPFVPQEVLNAADSVRASLPNRYCDPKIAADLFEEVIDEFLLCDDLGLNVLAVEHHAGINSLLGANPLLVGILARQTPQVRILSLGPLISVRKDPVRVAGQDAHEQGVGAEQRVDPGVVLDRQHVEPEVVAQEKLVDDLLEEIGGDLRIAVPVRQAGPHGVRGVEHLLRHERVRDFALPPSIHRFSLRSSVSDSGTSRRRRRRRRPARSLDDAPPARSARSVSQGSARYRSVHTTASRCRRWYPTARASAP